MDQKDLIEKLLKLFGVGVNTLKLNEIAKGLAITSDGPEYLLLKSVLDELCNEKILSKSTRRRYSLNDYEHLITVEGVLKIQGGDGYVISNGIQPMKIRIRKRHLNTAFDGDDVLVRLLKPKDGGKPRGEVVKILSRNETEIQGKIEFYDNIHFFVPDDEKYYVDFLINSNKLNGAEDGDKVKVKLLHWDNPQKSPQAEVVKVITSAVNSHEIQGELDSILDEFNLPVEFDDKVKAEAKAVKMPNTKKLDKGRLDLRKDIIITIDPADAKDFDDALSLKILKNGNRQLGVHIADVSYFVLERTVLDIEAYLRGNSVYLVDRVVPMLPEELSNEICSLKPKRIRFTFSVIMEIAPEGKVINYVITESVIKSNRRYSYEEVQEIIDGDDDDNKELILGLHALSVLLRTKRFSNGGVDFESTEMKFKLDENKNPIEAQAKRSTPATQLVEECMLLANKTIAEHIIRLSKKYRTSRLLPFLYRIHDEPLPDKLSDNLEFLKTLGVKFNLKSRSSKEINRIVRLFDNRPEKPLVHQIMLRSMAKAEYSNKNIGHFGLGFSDYAHFTSPIRRYPDLVVHRLLKEYAKGIPDKKRIELLDSILSETGKHCLDTEREAMEAERACVRLVQTFMARKYLGREMTGIISGITNFGIFVLMNDFYGEGLIHLRDLRDDYYFYDEKNHKLVGKRQKKVYKLSDKITVRIIHVNIEQRKIELELVSGKY